ncbi:aminopeptidase P family protein [soil metagenome]
MEFTSAFFSANRKRLLEETGAELVVLSAHGLLQRSADTTFLFRQDSNFWYLTGIAEPDYILVLAAGAEFLIAPPRAEHRDLWDGAIDSKRLLNESGVAELIDHHDGWNRLDRLIKKYKKIHTITPAESFFVSFGFYANPARGALLAALKKHRSAELFDIRKTLARMRQVKQPVELDSLKKAISITVDTLQDIRAKLIDYGTEYELVADVTAGFIRRGASGHAYQPIIAGGANAATIHYVRCNDDIDSNSLLLFDVGAEVNNYSADISRTYARNKPTPRQNQVYEAVARVHFAACALLKPGVDMKSYEQAVDSLMAVELKRLGLLQDETDKKKLKRYYPHLTSHFLGLDTHDAADYERPLEAGMVLTVEPGIYIPAEGIGVRIEDDVLITKTGIEVLSARLPCSLI